MYLRLGIPKCIFTESRKLNNLKITMVMDTQISSYMGSGNYRTPFMKHIHITYKERWVSMLDQSISNDYLLSSLHGGVQLTSHGCEVPNKWSRVIWLAFIRSMSGEFEMLRLIQGVIFHWEFDWSKIGNKWYNGIELVDMNPTMQKSLQTDFVRRSYGWLKFECDS
jgi:hypothetical protein